MCLKRFAILILLISSLMGCFRLRQPSDMPPQFNLVYLSIPDNQLFLTSEFQAQFKSLQVKLAQQPKQARYIFQLSNINFAATKPGLLATQTAINYYYSLSLKASLYAGNQLIATRNFQATKTIIVNSSQLYVGSFTTATKQALERNISQQILTWLTTDHVKNNIAHFHAPNKYPHFRHPINKNLTRKDFRVERKASQKTTQDLLNVKQNHAN